MKESRSAEEGKGVWEADEEGGNEKNSKSDFGLSVILGEKKLY